MVALVAIFIVAALSCLGQLWAKRQVKLNKLKRERDLRIAAGDLTGVKIIVPPPRYRQSETKKTWRRAPWLDRLFSPIRGAEIMEWQILDELPVLLDRLLRANARKHAAWDELLDSNYDYQAANQETAGSVLVADSLSKWWHATVESGKRTRKLGRKQRLAGIAFKSAYRQASELLVPVRDLLEDYVRMEEPELSQNAEILLGSAQWIASELNSESEPNMDTCNIDAEPDRPHVQAETLCGQLFALVVQLVEATRKVARIHATADRLKQEVESGRGAEPALIEPEKPVEQEVRLFVEGAVECTTGNIALEKQLASVLVTLKEAQGQADDRLLLVNDALRRLDDFSQRRHGIADDRSHVSFGGADGERRQNDARLRLPATSISPAPPRRSFDWLSRVGKSSAPVAVWQRPNRRLPSEDLAPAAPRLDQQWFISDQCEAMREAANMARHCCNDRVIATVRAFLLESESLIIVAPPCQAKDLESRTTIQAAMRKLGFALAQYNSLRNKMQTMEQAELEPVSKPSLHVIDANDYVQSVRSWQRSEAAQKTVKTARADEIVGLKQQVEERRRQAVVALTSLKRALPDCSSSSAPLAEALRPTVEGAGVLARHCDFLLVPPEPRLIVHAPERVASW